ncbi:MAG: cobalamin B12-binding domain-containing protein [Candidatus Saganbacteria bacterium]|nr:cobalamin B12-binding domain-containing protein [Candidatus Saganbacteria bacterium]
MKTMGIRNLPQRPRILLVNASTSTQYDSPVFLGKPAPMVYPLGMEYTAEALKARGFAVSCIDLPSMFINKSASHQSELMGVLLENERARMQTLMERVRRDNPDIVGFSFRNFDGSAFNSQLGTYLKALDRYVNLVRQEAQNSPVLVLGGSGFSIAPQSILDYTQADYGIAGPSEAAFPALIELIQQGEIEPGSVFSRTFDDFASTVYPRGQVDGINPWQYAQRGVPGSVQTRRGCRKRCDYCSYPGIEGREDNLRSADLALDEMGQLIDFGFSSMWLIDSVFNQSLDHAKAVLRGVIERGYASGSGGGGAIRNWHAFLTPEAFDRELVELFDEIGWGIRRGASDTETVMLDLDSGSDRVLAGSNKSYRRSHILDAVDLLKERDLGIAMDFLIGGQGEDLSTVLETCELVRQIKPEVVSFQVGVRIYPRTLLAQRYHGRLWHTEADLLSPTFAPIDGEPLDVALWQRYQSIIGEQLAGTFADDQIVFI